MFQVPWMPARTLPTTVFGREVRQEYEYDEVRLCFKQMLKTMFNSTVGENLHLNI